ncbi:MAG: undecaprenyl-diphosphate phosphatase [Alphaproteobacteria bacterium]|nr:undecaprenyl-diphosphate phosphatase [Alphaproteobacteria bacterium]
MQHLLDAGLLGIIEGLTEFIPVSSTGHLIIGEAFLKRGNEAASVFDVFIQIGAVLAVVWARRGRVLNLATGFFTDAQERAMGLKIMTAFMPAAIMGALFHSQIKEFLFTPLVVAISLIIGGVILLIVERIAPPPHYKKMDSMSFKTALGVGVFQIASLIPGVSRAGASIVGAQFLGMGRRAAAEFSFFLAIPTIFGAAVFDLYQNRHLVSVSDFPVFAVGTLMAFISALIVVNWMIDFVGKYGFMPFGYYRILAGSALLALLYLKVI